MKKLVLFVGLLTALPAFSQWFNVNASCRVSAATARCGVYNNLGRPIYCRINAGAVTRYGVWGNAYFNGWIPRRRSGYVYVNANNPYNDPLVRANASAQCRF